MWTKEKDKALSMSVTWEKINSILANYYCEYQDFEGDKVGLASALTHHDQLSIDKGVNEIVSISKHLADEISHILECERAVLLGRIKQLEDENTKLINDFQTMRMKYLDAAGKPDLYPYSER